MMEEAGFRDLLMPVKRSGARSQPIDLIMFSVGGDGQNIPQDLRDALH